MRNPSPVRYFLGLTAKALVIAWLPFVVQRAEAAITVGGLVVVGYTDNETAPGGVDEIAFLATETLGPGEVYITNNGWISDATSRQFSGKDNTGEHGAGNENLMKLTITSSIAAGTVLRTSDTGNPLFTWTTAGTIPTGNVLNTDVFSMLDLKHGSSSPYAYGDEIYLFQADGVTPYGAGMNPLAHPTSFIHALHMGNNSTIPAGFDPSYLGGAAGFFQSGGALPNGEIGLLNSGSPYYNAPHALQVGDTDDGDPDNDFSAFDLSPLSTPLIDGTFGINMSSEAIGSLQTSGGSKDAWLALLSNSSNWGSRANLSFASFNFTVVPEPSRTLLLLGGGVPLLLRRRRHAP